MNYTEGGTSTDIEAIPKQPEPAVMTADAEIDKQRDRYPFCIVWTPIPILTWLVPIIGHMGICTSNGVIRDFAGPYYVSEDNFAFGRPTKYWRLKADCANGGVQGWDRAVSEASDIYKGRNHIICWDNCHSHVATALNLMNYKHSKWNMIKLALLMTIFARYVNFCGVVKTWLPFLIWFTTILCITFLY